MEQYLQDYNDGAIYRTGVHSYEVRTSHGTGKGATVAEALKDLANQQVAEITVAEAPKLKDGDDISLVGLGAADLDYTVQVAKDIDDGQAVKLKPKKRKSSKKKKKTD